MYRISGKVVGYGTHPNGAWKGDLGYVFDRPFCNELTRFLMDENCSSVVDLGCGLADYVKMIKFETNMKCLGVDFNTKTAHLTGGLSVMGDLSIPLPLETFGGFPFEWCVCLGVGQHIPQSHETSFLENIDRSHSAGLVLSWDPPFSSTPGAHNVKDRGEVLHLFEYILRYGVDWEATQRLREAAEIQPLRENLYCFRKKGKEDNQEEWLKKQESIKEERLNEHFERTKML